MVEDFTIPGQIKKCYDIVIYVDGPKIIALPAHVLISFSSLQYSERLFVKYILYHSFSLKVIPESTQVCSLVSLDRNKDSEEYIRNVPEPAAIRYP